MGQIEVGTVLYGFCGGWFGRDSYYDKRVEGVGVDWIVARDNYGGLHIAQGNNIREHLSPYTAREEDS